MSMDKKYIKGHHSSKKGYVMARKRLSRKMIRESALISFV